jgi:hypothetical protein
MVFIVLVVLLTHLTTIEAGAKIHGMDEDEIEEMVARVLTK